MASSRVADFAAVNTKIRMLQGQFLTKQQYAELMECKSYKDTVNYIKDNTKYQIALNSHNTDKLHIHKMEIVLKEYYIKDIYRLSNYLNGKNKKFFKIFFMKYEIEDLKLMIRSKLFEDKQDVLKELITYKSKMGTIDFDAVASARNVSEVVEKLRESIYYSAISPLAISYEEDALFRVEMALDFIYFNAMRKLIDGLNKEDKDSLKRVNGISCDLLNIQWIIRGVEKYNMDPEILKNYTINDGYRLSKEVINNLCSAKSCEEIVGLLQNSFYKDIFKNVTITDEAIEREISLYLRNMYGKFIKMGGLNISVLLSYLELFFFEIKDLIAILENKRYGFDSDEVRKYITASI